jgi:septal ring factor EnvC (AmiA/AmiB activator)
MATSNLGDDQLEMSTSDRGNGREVMKCDNHGNILDVFCDTCQVLTCSECINESHPDHDWEIADDKCFEKHKKELEETLEKINEKKSGMAEAIKKLEKREEELKERREQVKGEIDQMEERMISVLKQAKVDLNNGVDKITEEKLRALAAEKELLEMVIRNSLF